MDDNVDHEDGTYMTLTQGKNDAGNNLVDSND
jgi:hypothetical protein